MVVQKDTDVSMGRECIQQGSLKWYWQQKEHFYLETEKDSWIFLGYMLTKENLENLILTVREQERDKGRHGTTYLTSLDEWMALDLSKGEMLLKAIRDRKLWEALIAIVLKWRDIAHNYKKENIPEVLQILYK